MYTEYFGFRRRPFADPDSQDACLSPAFEAALSCLRQQLADPHRGVLLFTGPAGAGKTLVLRRLLAGLPADLQPVLVWNAHLDFDQLLGCVFEHLALPPIADGRDVLEALEARLEERFEAGGTMLLVLDDAHLLAGATLEGLYRLTCLQRAGRPLLRLLLAGGGELQARLRDQPLGEQVDGHCRLPPLDRRQTGDYILAQLRAAGGGASLFSEAALEAVAQRSGGLPRLIHRLCSQALLEAFLAGRETVSADCVAQAAWDNPLPMEPAGAPEAGNGQITPALPERTEPAPVAPVYSPVAAPAAPKPGTRRTSWRLMGSLVLGAGLGGATLGALLVLAWTGYSADEALNRSAITPAGNPEFAAVVATVATEFKPLEPASELPAQGLPEPQPSAGDSMASVADPEPAPESDPAPVPIPASDPAPRSRQASQADLITARVARLLEQAERQLAELRYTRPAGDNALYSYRQVLRLDPGNPAARRGIAGIQASFLRWARAARSRGDLAKARSLLHTALAIDPNDAAARRYLISLGSWSQSPVRQTARRTLKPPAQPRTVLRRQGFVNRD